MKFNSLNKPVLHPVGESPFEQTLSGVPGIATSFTPEVLWRLSPVSATVHDLVEDPKVWRKLLARECEVPARTLLISINGQTADIDGLPQARAKVALRGVRLATSTKGERVSGSDAAAAAAMQRGLQFLRYEFPVASKNHAQLADACNRNDRIIRRNTNDIMFNVWQTAAVACLQISMLTVLMPNVHPAVATAGVIAGLGVLYAAGPQGSVAPEIMILAGMSIGIALGWATDSTRQMQVTAGQGMAFFDAVLRAQKIRVASSANQSARAETNRLLTAMDIKDYLEKAQYAGVLTRQGAR